jgi:hypothetical protein
MWKPPTSHRVPFRELGEADLICIWGGVNRKNLLATLREIEQFLTERQPTRVLQRAGVHHAPVVSRPKPRR